MAIHEWTYTGNIRGFTCEKNLRGDTIISEIELYDSKDYNKAPVLLHVSASLMRYVMDVEGHDDEERYMRKEFVYDDILCIRKIRVLNKGGKVCKIIREWGEIDRITEITGPDDRIDDDWQPELESGAKTTLFTPEYFKR